MLVVAPFIRLCLAVSSLPSPKQPGTPFIHTRQRRGAIKRRKNNHQISRVKLNWSKILLNSPPNQPGSLTHINLTWRRHVGERVRSSSRMKASEVYYRERASSSTRALPPPLFTCWPTSAAPLLRALLNICRICHRTGCSFPSCVFILIL